MELYSIKTLKKLLVESGSLDKISRNDYKLNFYDKCNWIITSIARKGFAERNDFRHFVPLHSNQLKAYLGTSYYKQVIDTLIKIGIINENKKYSTSRFSKSFRLSEKAINLGFFEEKIQTKRFQKVIDKNAKREFEEVTQNPILEKLIYNTSKLYLLNEWIYYVERILPDAKNIFVDNYMIDVSDPPNAFQVSRYNDFFKGFRALNNCKSPIDVYKAPICFKPSISKYGRAYHVGASIPKFIRACMRTKNNELLYEVDMSSAQLSILVLEWLRNLKNNLDPQSSDKKKEIKLCLKLLNEGGFYNYITKNSAYCSGLENGELKYNILKTLNAKYVPSELNKELKTMFPHFIQFINQIKQEKGHKSISHMHQGAESRLFFSVYSKLPREMFALVIHDCILVIKENTKLIKSLLLKKTKEIYKDVISEDDSLEGLFRIDRVSLKDEETDEYQLDKFNRDNNESV